MVALPIMSLELKRYQIHIWQVQQHVLARRNIILNVTIVLKEACTRILMAQLMDIAGEVGLVMGMEQIDNIQELVQNVEKHKVETIAMAHGMIMEVLDTDKVAQHLVVQAMAPRVTLVVQQLVNQRLLVVLVVRRMEATALIIG